MTDRNITNETVIHDAIVSAAGHIEKHPRLFQFHADRPRHCCSPGCALGWIAFFAKAKRSLIRHHAALPLLGLSQGIGGAFDFYDRMDNLLLSRDWRHDAESCAETMRLYASTYHDVIGRGFAAFRAATLTALREVQP